MLQLVLKTQLFLKEFSRVDVVYCRSLSVASISLRKGGSEGEQLGGERSFCSVWSGCFHRLLLCHVFLCGSSSLPSPRLVPSSSMWDIQPIQSLIRCFLPTFVH